MPLRLDAAAADFASAFEKLLHSGILVESN